MTQRYVLPPRVRRSSLWVWCWLALSAGAPPLLAQTSTATLRGTVVDTTAGVLPGAVLILTATETATEHRSTAASNGAFVFTSLPPGRYTLRGSFSGFAPTELQDLVLNAGDRITIRVELLPASQDETVTVNAEARRVSTAPSLSTVVNRQFVENLPLNGRSFQSLFELTPGVLIVPVRSTQEGGQFSVNGQRTNANYFMIDGVSAPSGMSPGDLATGSPGQSGSGQLPALTALGGTNSLLSVDALEEFRIHTSGYAPEFGRMPGGQVSLITRSGTNTFRGSVFDYFRDDSMDANSWFLNRAGISKPELSQHDFGGVLGGPMLRDRTFFFFSYEGLRLVQPKVANGTMPTLDARRNAIPFLQPFVNALPLPNGRDRGDGTADYTSGFSDPSRFDATSIRVDHRIAAPLTVFMRASHTPSYARVRNGSSVSTSHADSTSVTAGSTLSLSKSIVHDLRVNYSTSAAPFTYEPDNFDGAIVPAVSTVFFREGRDPNNSFFQFGLSGVGSLFWGVSSANEQRQFNIVDTLTMTSKTHELKFGLDFRRNNPELGGTDIGLDSLVVSRTGLATGVAQQYQVRTREPAPLAVAFNNLSIFAQDNWRVSSRLTATYGLRWEHVPPPHTTEGADAITLENIDNPYGGQVRLAPRGTGLWKTRYDSIAPRIGVSYVVSERPSAQLLLKGSWGKFYDLGFGLVANAYRTYPFLAQRVSSNISLAGAPASLIAIPLPTASDPPSTIYVMDPDLRMPSTYQWNTSVEQALGSSQTISVAYVAAKGNDLLKLDRYTIALLEWPADRRTVNVNRNRGYSDYRSLQLNYQRRLRRGWQSLVSYTLGRSRDTSSSDSATNVPAERLPPEADYGYSDHDVRHSLAAALTWQTPEITGSAPWKSLVRNWSFDVMFRLRSGLPLDIRVNVPFPPDNESARPNLVPGQPVWVEDTAAPGGRRLNRNAFSTPAAETQGDLVRGSIRGFSARQVDLALRREFGLLKRTRLQLRFEVFNALNTPTFQNPSGQLGSTNFGESVNTLANSLGGLNSMYQIGGPRSTQLAVKLLF